MRSHNNPLKYPAWRVFPARFLVFYAIVSNICRNFQEKNRVLVFGRISPLANSYTRLWSVTCGKFSRLRGPLIRQNMHNHDFNRYQQRTYNHDVSLHIISWEYSIGVTGMRATCLKSHSKRRHGSS